MVVFMAAKEVSSILRQWEMPQHRCSQPRAPCVAKPGLFPNHKPAWAELSCRCCPPALREYSRLAIPH